MAKRTEPMIAISKDVSVRRAFSLRESVALLLDDYATFLSDREGKNIKAGEVVEQLAAKLEKDSLFTTWRSQRGRQEVRPPTPKTGQAAATLTSAQPAETSEPPKARGVTSVGRGDAAGVVAK